MRRAIIACVIIAIFLISSCTSIDEVQPPTTSDQVSSFHKQLIHANIPSTYTAHYRSWHCSSGSGCSGIQSLTYTVRDEQPYSCQGEYSYLWRNGDSGTVRCTVEKMTTDSPTKFSDIPTLNNIIEELRSVDMSDSQSVSFADRDCHLSQKSFALVCFSSDDKIVNYESSYYQWNIQGYELDSDMKAALRV